MMRGTLYKEYNPWWQPFVVSMGCVKGMVEIAGQFVTTSIAAQQLEVRILLVKDDELHFAVQTMIRTLPKYLL